LGEVDVSLPSFHHDPAPEAMTRRARWYLGIATFRHGSLGLFCLIMPWLFGNAAFIPILDFLPIWGWGAAMAGCAVICGLAAVLRSGDWARWAMVISATITTVLAAGVLIGISIVWWQWITGLREVPVSPVLPIILGSLAAKDFVVCAQPIRSPFESVVRLVTGE
jgi:hypothetical protein